MKEAFARIHFAGLDVILDPSGALYCPEHRVMVVADLHFDKGQSIGLRTRRPLPPYDTAETLRKLHDAVSFYAPETVVCLGDSFHDKGSMARFGAASGGIGGAASGLHWVWIRGNHDPEIPHALGGEVATAFMVGPVLFRHDYPGEAAAGIVIGHFHPVALAEIGGRIWRRRCFVVTQDILVMPAFGSYTGGLNILHPDLKKIIGQDFEVYLQGRNGVYRVSPLKLRHERPPTFTRR